MIVVVSLNPSIDRTLMLSEFHIGETNRVQNVRVDAGGKGVNVCLHLRALDAEEVRCIGFMRQKDETMFSDVLSGAGVSYRWLSLPGRVRTNTKICTDDGTLTEVNESGEAVAERDVDELKKICRQEFSSADVVVLTGSVPPGVPKNIYAELTAMAKECGAICLLDADGDALRLGIEASPTLVKPNRSELERLLERDLPDDGALCAAADELIKRKIAYGCISLGEDGALFFSDAWKLRMPALNVPVRSTVGAGDAMTAAFALALEQQMGEKEAFYLAVSASAAAVTTEGTQPVDKMLAQKLMRMSRGLLMEIGGETTKSHHAAIISAEGTRNLNDEESAAMLKRAIRMLFVREGR